MRMLVTGGSGLLGAWVMRRLLARELNVRAFDVHESSGLLRVFAPERAAEVKWRTGHRNHLGSPDSIVELNSKSNC
jgi:UDP-glucose 4-epimerase